MRKTLIVLMSLLLTACVDDSASYYVDGPNGSHALTLRRLQQHLFSDEVDVELIMSRWPDCQRRLVLTQAPAEEVEIELYSRGDNSWTLREGKQQWLLESQTCTMAADGKGEPGELLGVYRVEGGKLVFEAAVVATDAANGAAPAAQQPPETAAPAGGQ
jgi:hypothetical protein